MNELFHGKNSLDEIKKAIINLKTSSKPVVIRKGLEYFDKAGWANFLRNNCQLVLDDRQYDYSENLVLTDWWEISYQPTKATSFAFSNTKQPLHTDNSWFPDPAEFNFFIMVKQAKSGGEQMIYTLDRLMSDLSKEEPGLYHDLCHQKVTIKKGDSGYANHTTIINLEAEPKIYWNYFRTEKPTTEIKNMCENFFQYLLKKESSSSVELIRCESGDCFSFNDLKMLHGRTAFTATEPYERVLLQSMWSPK